MLPAQTIFPALPSATDVEAEPTYSPSACHCITLWLLPVVANTSPSGPRVTPLKDVGPGAWNVRISSPFRSSSSTLLDPASGASTVLLFALYVIVIVVVDPGKGNVPIWAPFAI